MGRFIRIILRRGQTVFYLDVFAADAGYCVVLSPIRGPGQLDACSRYPRGWLFVVEYCTFVGEKFPCQCCFMEIGVDEGRDGSVYADPRVVGAGLFEFTSI